MTITTIFWVLKTEKKRTLLIYIDKAACYSHEYMFALEHEYMFALRHNYLFLFFH